MNSVLVINMMEQCDRVLILSRACRHLIDHVTPIWSEQYAADTDAIFIMQTCMDGPEAFVPEPKCEYEYPESSYGACDSLGQCGRPADESGYCKKHQSEAI